MAMAAQDSALAASFVTDHAQIKTQERLIPADCRGWFDVLGLP
jgi:hypothetical protein